MKTVISTQIQKVLVRNNQGVIIGNTVRELKTDFWSDGTRTYFYSENEAEFGKCYSFKHYKRLPSKIRNLFN